MIPSFLRNRLLLWIEGLSSLGRGVISAVAAFYFVDRRNGYRSWSHCPEGSRDQTGRYSRSSSEKNHGAGKNGLLCRNALMTLLMEGSSRKRKSHLSINHSNHEENEDESFNLEAWREHAISHDNMSLKPKSRQDLLYFSRKCWELLLICGIL